MKKVKLYEITAEDFVKGEIRTFKGNSEILEVEDDWSYMKAMNNTPSGIPFSLDALYSSDEGKLTVWRVVTFWNIQYIVEEIVENDQTEEDELIRKKEVLDIFKGLVGQQNKRTIKEI